MNEEVPGCIKCFPHGKSCRSNAEHFICYRYSLKNRPHFGAGTHLGRPIEGVGLMYRRSRRAAILEASVHEDEWREGRGEERLGRLNQNSGSPGMRESAPSSAGRGRPREVRKCKVQYPTRHWRSRARNGANLIPPRSRFRNVPIFTLHSNAVGAKVQRCKMHSFRPPIKKALSGPAL
jgi:hypothetical protein